MEDKSQIDKDGFLEIVKNSDKIAHNEEPACTELMMKDHKTSFSFKNIKRNKKMMVILASLALVVLIGLIVLLCFAVPTKLSVNDVKFDFASARKSTITATTATIKFVSENNSEYRHFNIEIMVSFKENGDAWSSLRVKDISYNNDAEASYLTYIDREERKLYCFTEDYNSSKEIKYVEIKEYKVLSSVELKEALDMTRSIYEKLTAFESDWDNVTGIIKQWGKTTITYVSDQDEIAKVTFNRKGISRIEVSTLELSSIMEYKQSYKKNSINKSGCVRTEESQLENLFEVYRYLK